MTPLVLFQPEHYYSVRCIHTVIFGGMNLTSFLTQPCTQIESLDKACAKFVYQHEGMVKGYVAAYQLDATHFRLNLLIHPQWIGRGIGTYSLHYIETHVRNQDGKYLQLRVLKKMVSSLEFALSKGFREIHRMRSMSLSADNFAYHLWDALGKRLTEDGFVATTYEAEIMTNNTLIDQLIELHRYARVGWESPDPTWKSDEDEET